MARGAMYGHRLHRRMQSTHHLGAQALANTQAGYFSKLNARVNRPQIGLSHSSSRPVPAVQSYTKVIPHQEPE